METESVSAENQNGRRDSRPDEDPPRLLEGTCREGASLRRDLRVLRRQTVEYDEEAGLRRLEERMLEER